MFYKDNLGHPGISDNHVVFTFATKSDVKASAILYSVYLSKD